MKRLYPLTFLILSLVLYGCSGGSAGLKCQLGVCIKIQAVEPVLFNLPVIVNITVTAETDMPSLGVSLSHDANVTVDNPQSLEVEIKNTTAWITGVSWIVDAKANLPLVFTRTLRLPAQEGHYTIVARASTPATGPIATDSFTISLTRNGGAVYYSGTPMPTSPGLGPTAVPLYPRTPLISTPTSRPYP